MGVSDQGFRISNRYKITFVCDLAALPKSFRLEAMTRRVPPLLYIGKADVILYTRVWEEECQHKRPGTFFRSVGAMLGYRSPRGGKNYQFAPQDKERVVKWIRDHLLVTWDCTPVEGSHATSEKVLIGHFMPLLNIQHSPRKFRELEDLRAICRAGEA